jgi:CRISPR/Cas system-associated endonuclease Cas1
LIHHLVLQGTDQDLRVEGGFLHSGDRHVAVNTLASVQCIADRIQWSQSALEALASQCPTVLARWNRAQKKWLTIAIVPRGRYVQPSAIYRLCRLSPQRATQLATNLLWAKLTNQHTLLRSFDPYLPEAPLLKENSFQRILRLEAAYAHTFWARYFRALSQDLFAREKRNPTHPLNIALSYGYGFLYHAIEWQALACGLDCSIGIVHRLRRSRPNLACDLIEPLRCCVELTVVRNLDEMNSEERPARMAGRFAEMLEQRWHYRGGYFRLRAIIRLMVESFVRHLHDQGPFHPFHLQARDALV